MGKQYFSISKNDFKQLSQAHKEMDQKLAYKKFNHQKILDEDKPGSFILELTILSLMRDRLKSSAKNKYFTNANGKAFVIITYDEIKQRLHCTGRSCTKALKDLKRYHFIYSQRMYKGPSKYYAHVGHYKNQGYYKFYYHYFEEFDYNLKMIYTYMLIRDLASMSEYTTNQKSVSHHFMDDDGQYFVAQNVSDICKKLKISLPTGGKIIKELESRGYIKRKQRRNSTSRIYLLK
ncbi:hypothetical protein ACYATO_08700 [Lactobacillaceae bacterium Melli_B3]